MLRQLSIRHVVLIDALDLAFDNGLCVLTGETGAGKSILLDALGLALGARANAALVQTGQAEAMVTAALEPAQNHPAWALAQDQGVIRLKAYCCCAEPCAKTENPVPSSTISR